MASEHDTISFHERVELRSPVLIAAFRGWNDAGDAASFAAQHLVSTWGARKIASVDPEDFFDFQATRPQVRLVDGLTREISWPANEFYAATLDNSPHDALILVGTEPNIRWRNFSSLVIELARSHDVSMLITLGALLADVPHSRPVPITGTAADPELIKNLGLQRSRYEGPTGIVGVLNTAFAEEGVGSASLWAAVPHYLAVTPNPKAALALVGKATELVGFGAETSGLERAAEDYERRVAELVSADDDVQEYVRLLEQRMDEDRSALSESEIPSGEALAEELERFLRERND
jgi:proteasome assembly chaperone (PAC2) family protein